MKTGISTVRAAFLAILAAGMLAGQAFAAATIEVNGGVQFNFTTPGARSLAMGGTFLGLADDATGAYTNPAGLAKLRHMEVAVEARRTNFRSVFTDRGRLIGPPSGMGIDTISGIQEGESESDVVGLSFISFVYPGERWAVAAHWQERADFETAFRTQGAYVGVPGLARLFPTKNRMDLDITSIGVSGSYRFMDRFAGGLGLSYYSFEIGSRTERFIAASLFDPPTYDPNTMVQFQTQSGKDNDLCVNLGLWWEVAPKWTMGAVFRQGPKFEHDVTHTDRFDPNNNSEHTTSFEVPNVYGVGVAFRPTPPMTISFDYDRVEYSVIGENMESAFNANPSGNEKEAIDSLKVDDADEFHLGFEYIFGASKSPIALRAGAWYDPDHKIRFDGDESTVDGAALAALFRRSSNEMHYTFGIGFVANGKVQIDAAYDQSARVDTASLSLVVHF